MIRIGSSAVASVASQITRPETPRSTMSDRDPGNGQEPAGPRPVTTATQPMTTRLQPGRTDPGRRGAAHDTDRGQIQPGPPDHRPAPASQAVAATARDLAVDQAAQADRNRRVIAGSVPSPPGSTALKENSIMPMKLNVGVSQKVGLPDYGSVGASCNLELELESSLLERDLEAFHARIRGAYVAAHARPSTTSWHGCNYLPTARPRRLPGHPGRGLQQTATPARSETVRPGGSRRHRSVAASPPRRTRSRRSRAIARGPGSRPGKSAPARVRCRATRGSHRQAGRAAI